LSAGKQYGLFGPAYRFITQTGRTQFGALLAAGCCSSPDNGRPDARLKSGSIADSCRGAHMSGRLSHRRPKTIVDQVPPESIRAAARDIACRAFDVHVLAVATCAIN